MSTDFRKMSDLFSGLAASLSLAAPGVLPCFYFKILLSAVFLCCFSLFLTVLYIHSCCTNYSAGQFMML